MTTLSVERAANALFPDVQMPLWAKILLGWAVAPTRRYYGGLWVGGTISLTETRLSFEANAVNRIFHVGTISFALDLRDIRTVRVEDAMVTDIVVVTTETGERRFRCNGAKDLARMIDEARHA